MESSVMEHIKGGLIVSCQVLKEESLHSSYIILRMVYTAMLGGAIGIRTNTATDIEETKRTIDLPAISIIKKVYGDRSVFITLTVKEIRALIACDMDIIIMDVTNRIRPDSRTLGESFGEIRMRYPDQLFMTGCSTYEEGMHAAKMGLGFIGTTLHGYTEYTKGARLPNTDLVG